MKHQVIKRNLRCDDILLVFKLKNKTEDIVRQERNIYNIYYDHLEIVM